jgi:hypothetical protein
MRDQPEPDEAHEEESDDPPENKSLGHASGLVGGVGCTLSVVMLGVLDLELTVGTDGAVADDCDVTDDLTETVTAGVHVSPP